MSTQKSGDGNGDSLSVVRVKPIGVGAGGVEKSVTGILDGEGALRYSSKPPQVSVVKSKTAKTFKYPAHVITPDIDNESLYDIFMPRRVQAFLDGVNVNVLAYGQTGTGKTHTMFGTPGIMEKASAGTFGLNISPDYGLFPRAIIDIFHRVKQRGNKFVLTASSVELSMILGNRDLLTSRKGSKSTGMWQSSCNGITLNRDTKPPRLVGMYIFKIEYFN